MVVDYYKVCICMCSVIPSFFILAAFRYKPAEACSLITYLLTSLVLYLTIPFAKYIDHIRCGNIKCCGLHELRRWSRKPKFRHMGHLRNFFSNENFV